MSQILWCPKLLYFLLQFLNKSPTKGCSDIFVSRFTCWTLIRAFLARFLGAICHIASFWAAAVAFRKFILTNHSFDFLTFFRGDSFTGSDGDLKTKVSLKIETLLRLKKSCYYNPDDTIDFVVKKKAMSDEFLFPFCQEICFKEFD